MPTSFPIQDLKTSIATEFIKVVWWTFCVPSCLRCCVCFAIWFWSYCISLYILSAPTTECFPVCLPACLSTTLCQQFHQDKNSNSTQLPASSTLILYLTLTHGEREGEEEKGGGMEHAANEPSVCEHVYLSFPNHSVFSCLSPPSLSPLPEVTGL